MKQMAKKLEKAEQQYNKDAQELEKLKAKMAKMRANCSHVPEMDKERGEFICKVCGEILGYTKEHQGQDDDLFDEQD